MYAINQKTILKIGQKHQGGIIFYLDNTKQHGKVCTENDLGRFEWQAAMNRCTDLILNGYSDWYLPSKTELNLLFLQRSTIGGFYGFAYWSSTVNSNKDSWSQAFPTGNSFYIGKSSSYFARPIRAF